MIKGLVAFFALFLLTGSAFAAAASVEIGYVESFDGKAADFELMRDGKPQTFALLAPIMNGDVIKVSKPSAESPCAWSRVLIPW